MVVSSNLSGQLGFFLGVVNDFLGVADPTALRLVGMTRVQMVIPVCHSDINYSILDNTCKLW